MKNWNNFRSAMKTIGSTILIGTCIGLAASFIYILTLDVGIRDIDLEKDTIRYTEYKGIIYKLSCEKVKL